MVEDEEAMADGDVCGGIEADLNVPFCDYDEVVTEGQTSRVNDKAEEEEIFAGFGEMLKVNEPEKLEDVVAGNVEVPDGNKCDKAEASHNLDKDDIRVELVSIKSRVCSIEERVGDVGVSQMLSEIRSVKKRIGVIEEVLGIKSQDDVGENKVESVDANKPLATSDAHTPIRTNVGSDEKQKLFYTDFEEFTGPMTQVVKAALSGSPEDTHHSNNFMQVDNKFDRAALPNLNDAFSNIAYDGFDPTPVDESMDMNGAEK